MDLRLNLEDREDLLILLKMRFMNLCPNKHLKLYGIPVSSLKDYKSNKNDIFENDSLDKYRLRDQELSQEEPSMTKAFSGFAEKVD